MAAGRKVIVALSGGVDSAVAAALLRQQGYECVGVFMRVGVQAQGAVAAPGDAGPRLRHGCCSAADAADARAVAGRLGIPFYVLNFADDFDRIIDYFVDEYARARTPNPCILCNSRLKFGKLLAYAELAGAQFVATGHHARLLRRDGQVCLARARNLAKDQSYVLFDIRRENLLRCLFPLGEIADKRAVRQIAADLGLRVRDKPESQEICFVPQDDYRRLVYSRRPAARRVGEIRDAAGNVLGRHEGVAGFTIGQRRGLGIAVGKPLYVTRLDAHSNTVTVGPHAELLAPGLMAERVNWLSDPPRAPLRATIQIRSRHRAAPGLVVPTADNAVIVRFDRPQAAVTPGQAAVFYGADGVVLGGGWIRCALDDAAPPAQPEARKTP